jgi:DEAD/DEAH box helicase domain-containing protein
MMDHVVLDVEIAKTIEQAGGWENTELMGVGCAVLYEYQLNRFRLYGPEDVEELKARLLAAERITGYNIWRFDFPVIWGLPGRGRVEELRPKCNDLLVRIWESLGLDAEQFSDLHKGWGLDAVARGTLGGGGKTGNGADAPIWFQAGQWAKLVDYCLEDVRLERDLGEFIDRHGYVVNANNGRVLKIRAGGGGGR